MLKESNIYPLFFEVTLDRREVHSHPIPISPAESLDGLFVHRFEGTISVNKIGFFFFQARTLSAAMRMIPFDALESLQAWRPFKEHSIPGAIARGALFPASKDAIWRKGQIMVVDGRLTTGKENDQILPPWPEELVDLAQCMRRARGVPGLNPSLVCSCKLLRQRSDSVLLPSWRSGRHERGDERGWLYTPGAESGQLNEHNIQISKTDSTVNHPFHLHLLLPCHSQN